jgi:predicted enzyme related to lactoylglutathione lyase
MDKNSNSLNWFEIPALDLERAKKFYETVFATELEPISEMMGMSMSVFPADPAKVGGALVKSQYHVPSSTGAWVYLNANPSMQAVVDRIAGAGGTVTMPPMQVSPEIGYMAGFVDSEGNAMALHANSL